MDPPRQLRLPLRARWFLAIAGVALTVWSFVQLVEVSNRLTEVWPWWLVGITGVALTVLALGSPRPGWRAGGDGSTPAG